MILNKKILASIILLLCSTKLFCSSGCDETMNIFHIQSNNYHSLDVVESIPLLSEFVDEDLEVLAIKKMIAAYNSNVTTCTQHDYDSLIFACQNQGDQALKNVKYLIDQGADVNASNNKFITPLMFACQNEGAQALEIVKFLVDHGADIGTISISGTDVLMCTSYNFNSQVVSIAEFLIDRGADLHHCDKRGWTALECAHRGNNILMKNFFKNKTKINNRCNCNIS